MKMGSLWNFFGLPDPEGSTPAATNTPPPAPAASKPVALTGTPAEESAPQSEQTVSTPTTTLERDISGLRTPPLGWNGPLTPDGEAFHDLGVERKHRPYVPDKALRYIAPDVMKRIPTTAMLERVLQGDTAIVDLRSLVHMESHQMACRREIKHMADHARVSVFSLDAEDKLLMIPGQNVVVDMQKHELGLTPLL
jgi:hypothetical protein